MIARRRPSLADYLRRCLAAGCAGLVFALTIFAASPIAHERLHDDGCGRSDTTEDRCAVVLFANGVSPAVDPLALTPPSPMARNIAPATAEDIFLVSPRYLRQPERGPPGRG